MVWPMHCKRNYWPKHWYMYIIGQSAVSVNSWPKRCMHSVLAKMLDVFHRVQRRPTHCKCITWLKHHMH